MQRAQILGAIFGCSCWAADFSWSTKLGTSLTMLMMYSKSIAIKLERRGDDNALKALAETMELVTKAHTAQKEFQDYRAAQRQKSMIDKIPPKEHLQAAQRQIDFDMWGFAISSKTSA